MPPIFLDGRAAPVSHVQPSPPPPPHTVKPGETLDSIAKAHGVSTQELATANRLAPNAKPEPGQQLQLPPNAKLSTEEQDQSAPKTPQEKTDAAYDTYLQAQYTLNSDRQSRAGRADVGDDQATLAQAKKSFDQAVQSEIAGKVAQTNAGVPGEYRTPEPQLITQFGNQIAQRYAGDSTGKAEVQSAVADYQTTRTADALIPGYAGNWSAVDKLKGINLDGQPPAVVDKVLADPRVKQWVKDATTELNKGDPTKTLDSLNDLFKDSPELATALSASWWQSDQLGPGDSIATCYNATETPEGYTALASLYASLGNTPAGKQVQQQIADTLGQYSANNVMLSGNNFERAIGEGGDPTLALAAAGQLQSAGKGDQAQQLVGSVSGGISLLSDKKLAEDTEAYSKQTAALGWFIKNLGTSMTPAQKQAAIDDYIKKQGPDWQNAVNADKAALVADAKQLNTDMLALQNLPASLQKYQPLAKGIISKVTGSENAQQAMEFAMSQDPGIFAGEDGDKTAQLWVEAGHKSKDLGAALAKAYVTSHVLPELKDFNPLHPEDVAKAHQALENLRSKAGLLGISKSDLDKGINELEESMEALSKESLADAKLGKGINTFNEANSELQELSETKFTSGASGLLFRTLGFGLSGAALINQAKELGENPDLQNMLGTLALSAGFAQDTAGLAAKIGIVDKSGSLGSWGLGTSAAGEATEKFMGVLSVAYYSTGSISALADKDYGGAALDAAGAVGMGIATFGEAAWTGPVGWGITLAATLGLGWYEHVQNANQYEPQHNADTVPFLMHAGYSQAAATILCNQSGNGYSPAALLAQYATDKGYDLSNPAQQKTFVDWVNRQVSSKPTAMGNLRDLLDMAQDKFGGDTGKLSKDTLALVPMQMMGDGTQVYAAPQSTGQIDAYLSTFGLAALPPP